MNDVTNGANGAPDEPTRAKIATREYDFENAQCTIVGAGVTFNFANGESLVCDPADLPEEVRSRVMLFGLGTRIRNAYASVKGDVVAAAKIARDEFDQLKRGVWVERASGGEESVAPSIKVLAECLAEVTGKDSEACLTAVQKLDKKTRAGLRRDPRIAALYEAKRPKKAPAQVDLASLLNV